MRAHHLMLIVLLALLGDGANLHSGSQAAEPMLGSYSGAIPTEYPDWFKNSFLELEEDVREAAANGKRLLLVFHQDNCPYCNKLIERNLSQKDIAEAMQASFDVVAINMWADREVIDVGGQAYTEKAFAEALAVQFTPTLLFFDEDGKIVLRLNGYLPPAQFRLALDYVRGHHEGDVSFNDFQSARAPRPGTGNLNPQPFFADPPYDLSKRSGPWDRPLAVFFEQSHCPNCDTLHRQVLTDGSTRDLIEQFTVAQLDMWSAMPLVTPEESRTTAREWARDLGIQYAPTIVLFNRDGDEIIRTEGYFKVFHTQSVFDFVLSDGYRSQPNFQRYLTSRADALRERGVDVDIWR